MDSATVLAEAPVGGSLPQLIKAKRHWKVSVSALVYRMHGLNMLTDWQYRSLFIEIGRLGYRTAEPNGSPRETSQVLARVFSHLRDQSRSLPDVARELGLPPAELAKSLFGLVLTQIEGGNEVATGGRASLRIV